MSSSTSSSSSSVSPITAAASDMNLFAKVVFDALILSRKTESDEDFNAAAKKMFKPFAGSVSLSTSGKKKKKSATAGSDIKRPKSPYMFFMQEKRSTIASGTKFGDVAKQIATLWAALSEEEKIPYVTLSNNDKVRYENQKEKAKTQIKTE